MTPLSSSSTSGTTARGIQQASLVSHQPAIDASAAMNANVPGHQGQNLKRATYVKVIDLATLNKLDVEKIKEETSKKRAGDVSGSGSGSGASQKDDGSHEPSHDDCSLHSGQKPTRYQKRAVPSTGGFNLCLLVGRVNIVVKKTRVDKSQVRLAECEVGDETGTVSLRARDEQISLLQEISAHGSAVVLRNCSLELYQGKFIRLAISKWGKISSYPDGIISTPTPPTEMNHGLDLSIVDLNDVAGDEWFETSSVSLSQKRAQRDNAPTDSCRGGSDPKSHPRAQSHHHQQHHQHQYHQNHNQHRKGGGRGHNNDKKPPPHVNYPHPGAMPMAMNPNVTNSFTGTHMYSGSMPPYGFGHAQMQSSHQHQHYDAFQYNMHMQYEAIRLYPQQHPQQHHHQQQHHLHHHQHDRFLGSMLPQASQAHAHHGHSADQESHAISTDVASFDFASRASVVSDSSTTGVSNTPAAHASPELMAAQSSDYQHSTGGISQKNKSSNSPDAWSISHEVESPMMNPHAATFTSAYPPPPSFSLPQQHYYQRQPPSYGFALTHQYGSSAQRLSHPSIGNEDPSFHGSDSVVEKEPKKKTSESPS